MANAEKISGFVKGSPKGKTFVVGSKKGEFTVDASKATVRLNGKFFSISKLTGGSQVTVDGTVKGKNIDAKTVDIGSLRGAPAVSKTVVKSGKTPAPMPGHKPGPKPMDMPTAKSSKPTAKTGKPKTDAHSKDKPKTESKTKAKAKTDDKSKTKTKK